MHSFAAPARKPAVHRLAANGLVKTGAGVSRHPALAVCVIAFALAAAGVTTAHAQDTGGTIMIAGPAETNPAAVVAMAKSAGMSVDPNATTNTNQPASPAQPAKASRPAGYAAAANAADAAMRAAALALDAHADAADASSSSSGLIVIPGPGEAKTATAPKLAMSPSRSTASNDAPDAGGLIEIPGNGEPKAATNISNVGNNVRTPAAATDTLPRVTIQATASSRDVMPVVVTPDGGASAQGATRIATRGFQARPIAAAPATPVAGMMPVSMRPAAAIRAPLQPTPATADGSNQLTQDGDSIRAAALAFLTQQAAGLPGKADITVTPVFPRGLAACSTLEPFLPAGSRLWGRTTVGVRCSGERPWTLYLQARVSVMATYYLAARAVAPGEVLSAADLIPRDGDLTTMPQAIVTDPSQAVGAVTLSRLAAGLPLRTDMLRGAGAIVIGQTVHVVTNGAGFSISAEGSAMNNAAPGQQVRVKTAGGQIISGVAKDASTVEIQL
ncbi:flagellar basal body P-ring formation protein FlgA [Caballeronia sp. SEWSISQ10-4 2]|uniref:flagellar basal body P-ring formation chaperone FlgA n=1 Tax=Caballeronia sp. SEWSISQ10-4 2 TaxID=2937438 RepID=UPI002650CD44|nr:flagellar basal body P-ring formation chaperone FlgA [Caballeronia sp. SEWSISQ10-4 2]MDN7182047.1 flagellar basal body P-ring formation protein FlgA [Caballeronia sp. SEWSISQ10-4 2]